MTNAILGRLRALALTLLLGLMVPSVRAADEVHEPIQINDPSDVVLKEPIASNGIREGTGTPDDPYVISQWTITGSSTVPAIQISNVQFSFRISDVILNSTSTPAPALRAEGASSLILEDLDLGTGSLVIDNVGSVLIRNLRMSNGNISITGVRSFVIENSDIESVGFHIEGADVVRLDGVSARRITAVSVKASPSPEVTISKSTFVFSDSAAAGFLCASCKSLRVFDSTFKADRASYEALVAVIGAIQSYGDGVEFERSRIDSPVSGLYVTGQRQNKMVDSVFAGDGAGASGIKIDGNLTMVGNEISGFQTGVELYSLEEGLIERLRVSETTRSAVELQGNARHLEIENSVFSNVGCGFVAPFFPGEGFPGVGAIYERRDGHDVQNVRIRNSSFHDTHSCAVYVYIHDVSVDAASNWWDGPDSPPVGWNFPEAGLVSPETVVDPRLSESPHGLRPSSGSSVPSLPAFIVLGVLLVVLRGTLSLRDRT